MVAVDVLHTSLQLKRYILMIQDYSPKCNSNGKSNCHYIYHNQRACESFLLPWFTRDIALGLGGNFESSFLHQTLDHMVLLNHKQQHTIATLKEKEYWRDLSAHFYKCCVYMYVVSQIGRYFFHW